MAVGDEPQLGDIAHLGRELRPLLSKLAQRRGATTDRIERSGVLDLRLVNLPRSRNDRSIRFRDVLEQATSSVQGLVGTYGDEAVAPGRRNSPKWNVPMNAIAPYIFGFGGEPWDKLDLGKRREKLGDHLAALGFLSEPVSDETIRVWQELHIIPAVSHRTAELLISLGYPQAPPTTEIVFSDFTYHIDKAGRFTELYCNLVLRALSKDGVTKVSRRHTYFGDCDNENMLHFYPMSHCSIELKEYDGVEGWTVVFLLGDKVTPESGPYSFSYRVKVRAKRPPKRVVSMTARSQPIRGVRRVQFHPEAVPSRVWYFENLQRSSMVYPPYSEEFKLEPDSASSVERVLTTNGNTDAGIRWEFDVSLAGGLNVAVAKGVTAMGDE